MRNGWIMVAIEAALQDALDVPFMLSVKELQIVHGKEALILIGSKNYKVCSVLTFGYNVK